MGATRVDDTRLGIGAHELGVAGDAVAPDTIRNETAPLAPPQREPAGRVPTAPMVATVPLARAAVCGPRLTYDVYSPDDTLRRARALGEADATRAAGDHDKRRRLGLGALGLAVTLGTTLLAIGSCEDSTTSRVETTAAVTTASTAAPVATPTAEEVIPPIVFSPPLAQPPPARSRGGRPKR